MVKELGRSWRQQLGGDSYFRTSPLPSQRLREYTRMKDQDVTLKFALDFTSDLATSYLVGIRHPDPEVNDWLQGNLDFLRWEMGKDFPSIFREWFRVSLWAGFCVGENLYRLNRDGRVWLEDVVIYEPSSILIKPDKRGRLTEGGTAEDGSPCGFWQMTSRGPVHLPLWKVCWISHNAEFGNYYGRSFLDPAYRWYLIEQVVTDMMVDALDHFGHPLVALKFHEGLTQERKVDPNTGQERAMTVREVLEAQIEENRIGGRNVLLLGYTDPQMQPDVKVLSTGNNVGSTFMEVIQFCDAKKLQSFLMPFALVGYKGEQDTRSVERQVELFYRGVRSKAQRAYDHFVAQTWLRLMRINFPDRDLPPPELELREVLRPEDRVSMMQMVSGLTRLGYLNPNQEQDWQAVRNWVNMVQREFSAVDREFIEQVTQSPGAGRPSGTSKPQDEPREPDPDSL